MKNLEKNVKCIMMKLDNKEIIVVNQKFKIKIFKNFLIIFSNKQMKLQQNVQLVKRNLMFMIVYMKVENHHQIQVENLYQKKRKKLVIINYKLKNSLLILKILYKV